MIITFCYTSRQHIAFKEAVSMLPGLVFGLEFLVILTSTVELIYNGLISTICKVFRIYKNIFKSPHLAECGEVGAGDVWRRTYGGRRE